MTEQGTHRVGAKGRRVEFVHIGSMFPVSARGPYLVMACSTAWHQFIGLDFMFCVVVVPNSSELARPLERRAGGHLWQFASFWFQVCSIWLAWPFYHLFPFSILVHVAIYMLPDGCGMLSTILL